MGYFRALGLSPEGISERFKRPITLGKQSLFDISDQSARWFLFTAGTNLSCSDRLPVVCFCKDNLFYLFENQTIMHV